MEEKSIAIYSYRLSIEWELVPLRYIEINSGGMINTHLYTFLQKLRTPSFGGGKSPSVYCKFAVLSQLLVTSKSSKYRPQKNNESKKQSPAALM